MGLGSRINRATDLWYPELDTEVCEDRERQSELAAVERALRFTDHDSVEAPVRVAERIKKPQRLGSAFPREGAGLADVEELGGDLATDLFNDLS